MKHHNEKNMSSLRPNMVNLLIEADAQFWGNRTEVQIQECMTWCTYNAIISERQTSTNGVGTTLSKIFRKVLGDNESPTSQTVQRVYWLTFTDLNDDSIIAHLRVKV